MVVCSREGLGQQLLHVEGTLTAISRTEATSIKPLSPSNPTFTLGVINVVQPLRNNLFYEYIYSSTVLRYKFEVLEYLLLVYFRLRYTSTPLFRGKYNTFYSAAFINSLLYRLSF